jgi:hypothetical protein
VEDVRGGVDDDAQPCEPRLPAEQEVLLVHEQLVREASELAERVGAHRQRRPARGRDVVDFVDALGRLTVAAGPGKTAHVHLETA